MSFDGSISAGFKQTDIGPIPKDWDAAALSGFSSTIDCKHVTAKFVSSGFPVASIQETQSKHITLSAANQTSRQFFEALREGGRDPRSGDLIMSRNATVGKVAMVSAKHPPFAMGQDVCLIRPLTNRVEQQYLWQALNAENTKFQIELCMVGSTFRRINVQQIKALTVPLPPLPEQKAIAEALSDVDGLNAELEALVAKKRDLKQAAAQTLLTGETRLPGFSEDWQEVKLGDLLSYEQPTKYIVESSDYVETGTTPVLTAGKSVLLGYTEETTGIYARLPTIIFDDFTTASKLITFPFKVKSSAMKMLTPRNEETPISLIYELMQLVDFPLSDHKRYWISEYQHQTITMPPTIEEQTAISTILSDMDAEIEALEAQLAKTRDLKTGMMQDLLTGRVRLTATGERRAA